MNKQKLPPFLQALMITLVLVMLVSLTGGATALTASAKRSSYIVQATSTDLAARLTEKYGGTVTSRLDIIHAVGAMLSDQAVVQLRLEKGILAITPNGSIKSSNDLGMNDNKVTDTVPVTSLPGGPGPSLPSTDYPDVVGADVVWSQGVIGSGVTVAVLDTGLGNIDALTKKASGPGNRIVGWKDFIENKPGPLDPNGHGTHVAGIIANTQKGNDGEWNGVAPGVNLVGVRVLDEDGVGTYESVISGLQWVFLKKSQYNIRIVNLSLVAPVQSAYWADPLNQAVTAIWASGITVIVAAGNSGPNPLSITVPGNNPYVVTVGAFTDNFTPNNWDDDYITPFSGAGPTLDGFAKPDLVAPGAHMVSVVPDHSLLVDQYPANKLSDKYFKLAGTSQATAVVSGVAALILSRNPGLTPNEVKMRLTASALPWVNVTTTDAVYSMWQQGAGVVNAPDAVFANISGAANAGLDIQADLTGNMHYEGYSYYDEPTATYRLYDPFADWAGGYGEWNGGHGAWTGGHGAWASGHGAWASGHGAWASGYGTWAGGYSTWTGGHGAWASGHGAWAGGYSTWAGGHGAWASGHGAWAGSYEDPSFVSSFIAGDGPDASTSSASISYFLQDP